MIKKKKTMYEILELTPDASYSEIKAAYQQLSEKLHAERNELNGEDIDFKLRVINVAFHTLSVPASRDAYDAQLAPPNESEISVPTQNAVVVQPNVDSIYLRSDATALRADAASLRADAIMLRADALSLKVGSSARGISDDTHMGLVKSAFSNLASPVKKILLIFGTVVAMIMVIQVVFLLFAGSHAERSTTEAAKAEEKLYLQEYYQTHGVRPASRIEADLLDAENRRKENDLRTEDREQKRQEEESRRFAEESRKRGEQISETLRRDEERARLEEERKQDKLEQERRREEEAEIDRIEREKARWRSSNYRSSGY